MTAVDADRPHRFSVDHVRGFAQAVLVAIGMPSDDASIAADAMVWNNRREYLEGIDRVFQVRDRAKGGGLSLDVDWTPLVDKPGVTLLDAGNGLGIVGGIRGMSLAVDKAREVGVSTTVVRNCDVTAAIGAYSGFAAERGMIGFAISNGDVVLPPWGGRTALFGDQPFSIAVPTGRHPMLIWDGATTAVNSAHLEDAAAEGRSLPPGVALNAKGEPTTDPAEALESWLLLPMGGHRGGGVAVMWEVFTGILAGARSTTEVTEMSVLDQPTGNSLYLQAIDPSAFMPYEEFLDRVDRLIDQILATPPIPGGEPVRVPGSAKMKIAEDSDLNGIPFTSEELESLRALGDEFGVSWDDWPEVPATQG